jgi:hypothetical protein
MKRSAITVMPVIKLCRSEHAREKLEGTTGYQVSRVIVDVHREHARSYTEGKPKRQTAKSPHSAGFLW